MRYIYSAILYLLLPVILIRLLYRSIENPAYRARVSERFGLFRAPPNKKGIWVHAVSVGESVAAVKLIKALQAKYPNEQITATCGTPTGSNIIRQQLGRSVYHVYAPYDLPGSVRRFLNKVQPRVGIILETELWPNVLRLANQSGTKLMIANMHLSDTSTRRYKKFAAIIRPALANVGFFATQTQADAGKAISIGALEERVAVFGNLKFELDVSGPSATALEKHRQTLVSDRAVWVAGSTHKGEDEPVLDVHADLLSTDPNLLLILAPRHPERFHDIEKLCRARFRTQKRSDLAKNESLREDTQVLVLNTIGELSQFIGMSDWSFIGGSLVPIGGHNLLEACHQGIPVLFGPYMDSARQVAQIVIDEHAGFQVDDKAELLSATQTLLNEATLREEMGAKGKALIRSNAGALDKTLDILESWV